MKTISYTMAVSMSLACCCSVKYAPMNLYDGFTATVTTGTGMPEFASTSQYAVQPGEAFIQMRLGQSYSDLAGALIRQPVL